MTFTMKNCAMRASLLAWSLAGSTAMAATAEAPPVPVLGTAEVQATTTANPQQPTVPYANLWADAQGHTHVAKCELNGMKLLSYAPPAAPEWFGTPPEDIQSITYAVLPVGYVGSWHHAPGPQWVVTLSGQWSVEATDGQTLVQGPGDFQFNADTSSFASTPGGKVGHISRTVGNVPNVQLIIKLKPRAGVVYAGKPCAV
ncbi:hypothetical protein [Pseudomonas sp. RIT-To-2]|uniref:hypothetical protein n=1 Tax=Pseudomonas sp. RIT-To-2 TaxID=3462541 RepID=UPI004048DD57